MPRQTPVPPDHTPAPAPKGKKAKSAKGDAADKSPRRPWEDLPKSPPPSFMKGAASFFADQSLDAESKNGGVLVGTAAERVCIGVPFKAFSLQYAHCSDVYPLGRMEMIIGESDSCKTALLFEKMRWFLREPNAGAAYLLNEARDPAVLRSSIIGNLLDERFKLIGPHDSLEHWQRNLTGLLHQFENTFKTMGGCAFPVLAGLDSITGTTNEGVIETIDKLGHAKLTFGQDANLLNMYAKYLFQRVYRWPIAFICTNHIKYGTDRYNNRVMRIPGGDELRYVSTYITHLSKVGKDLERRGIDGGRRLKMKLMKSMGDHREIEVDFVWSYPPGGGQVSTWDWHTATVELLSSFPGEKGKAVEKMVTFPNYNKTSRTCACPEAGVRKPAPLDVVGQAIMQKPKLLAALQDFFGVRRYRTFQEGVPYAQQIRDAVASGDVAPHDNAGLEPEAAAPADDEADDQTPSELPADS